MNERKEDRDISPETPEFVEAFGRALTVYGPFTEACHISFELDLMMERGDSICVSLSDDKAKHRAVAALYPYLYTISERAAAKDTEPRMTFAHAADGCQVKLVRGLACPDCGRRLHALDVEVDQQNVRLICSGCYVDILLIEKRGQAEPAWPPVDPPPELR